MIDTLVILGGQVLSVAGVYALGFHRGKAPEFVDTRKCLCGHDVTSHYSSAGKLGNCRAEPKPNYVCACGKYIADPKAEML